MRFHYSWCRHADNAVLSAHAGAGHDLWRAWNLGPALLGGLAVTSAVYAFGVRRLWRSAGTGRGVTTGQAACYGAGIAALAVALVSPLDAFGEALFWAHMVQHLVLILVAAPLLVLGSPVLASLWVFDAGGRRRLGRWWNRARILPRFVTVLTTPLVAWGLHVSVLWAWHLPSAYQAALANESIHAIEHLSFLGTALLFWWVVLQPAGRRRLNRGMAVLYVVTAGMQGGLLGALLTFAGTSFYPAQSAAAATWGLTPLEDQQLAGLIMWLPAGLVYLGAAAALFLAWLRVEDGSSAVVGAWSANAGWSIGGVDAAV